MPINRGMDKEDVVHMYNGILINHKKEQNNASCSNMNGLRDCHAEQSKSEKDKYMILLMLSHFSCVRLCATPQMAAHKAPLSLGFSRQEHWSGLPFPSPMRESEVAQSCPTLSDPMDCSLTGSSVHGIFQARVLEWGAIAFSETDILR